MTNPSAVNVRAYALPKKSQALCPHCQTAVAAEGDFCCAGCHVAHRLIHEFRLGDYYALRSQLGGALPSVKDSDAMRYESFDSRIIQEQITEADGSLCLLLPSLSCYACVWLCEQALRQRFPELRAAVNLSQKSVSLRLGAEGSLSDVATFLHRLGYPSLPGYKAEQLKCLRTQRTQLGVAWLCAVNIMAFAAAEYADQWAMVSTLPASWHLMFRGLQAVLMIPVLLVSARVFFEGAARAIVQRRASIDIPIVVSFVLVGLYSLVHVADLTAPIYFDSLSAGVALLLSGRAFQHGVMQKMERGLRARPMLVQRVGDRGLEWIQATELLAGDRVRLYTNDIVPTKAILLSDEALVSEERVTGETRPQLVRRGEPILAQSVVLHHTVDIQAEENGATSHWKKLEQLASDLRLQKTSWDERAEKAASLFFVMVMCVAAACLIIVGGEEGARRAIACLLIACPCAFGFAIPMSLSSIVAEGFRRGLRFRSHAAIEKLARSRDCVFDKTGTLTCGHLELVHVSKTLSPAEVQVLAKMCAASQHPYVLALTKRLVPRLESVPDGVHEQLGSGLEYIDDNHRWRLGHAEYVGAMDVGASMYLSCDGKTVATFELRDRLQMDSLDVIRELACLGVRCHMLTGDHSRAVDNVAQELSVSVLGSGCSPMEKAQQLKQLPMPIMVGNGANDAVALAASGVGVAVQKSSALAHDSADVVLDRPGLRGVVDAIQLAKQGVARLQRCFCFAGIYNVFGLGLASAGFVHPLLAAVLMPISSLVIVSLATWKWKRS